MKSVRMMTGQGPVIVANLDEDENSGRVGKRVIT